MAFARVLTLRLAVPSRTPAGPKIMHVRDVYGGRGHFTEESSQYLPSMRVPGWLGGTTLDWNAHASSAVLHVAANEEVTTNPT